MYDNIFHEVKPHSKLNFSYFKCKSVILTRISEAKACSLADIQVIQDQFTEHHVGPREPFTRIESWVVHVEAFVHNTCAPSQATS